MSLGTQTLGKRRWNVQPPLENAADLARQIGTAPLIVQALHNRGVTDVEAAKAFLAPKLTDLHDPALLPNIDRAAKRIARAIAEGEPVVIYGDYDVDGMTGVATLHTCLKLLGAQVSWYVPHRLEEGYGVNVEAVRKLAADGAKLLVTVDCGISAVEPVAAATAAGVDVIITDHHEPDSALPQAYAIVHPLLEGSQYPNRSLCGSGVAFKLAWQVSREVCGSSRVDPRMRDFLVDATCMAALGTIADVVPLVGENRALATFGLRGLPSTRHAGLRAMLESSKLTDEKLDAYHVGFILAPRLNACGRMGHARLAVELLTDAPPDRCMHIAQYLALQNAQRQKTERAITDQAVEMIAARGLDGPDRRAIVLASADWHAGVIGIVASRLVERYGKPAILIALNGEGMGQGSGRSIPGFNIREAIAACSEHVIGFGGHAMAGGLRLAGEKVEAFTEAFERHAGRLIDDQMQSPPLAIDAQTTLSALNLKVVEHLERMAPFGPGNPHPLVLVPGCKVLTAPKRMGKTGSAVNFLVGQDGVNVRVVGFGMGDLADDLVGVNTVDLVGEPVLNRFNGRVSVELQIKDIRRA